MERVNKLSVVEATVMEEIWKYPQGIDSDELYARFSEKYAVGTIGTLISRIVKKGGYIKKARKGKHTIIIPLISKLAYYEKIDEQDIQITYEKIEQLLIEFSRADALTPEQSERLKKLLTDMRNDYKPI